MSTNELTFIPQSEFQRIGDAVAVDAGACALIADMCRLNALTAIMRAGSGHIGSSFSSLDIVTALYFSEMNIREVGFDSPDRDIYFSSKGHDAPGLYAILHALGVMPQERFLNLRRLGGTHGHPDVSLPGIEANTGSLGMGISKGKGMAIAKRLARRGGRIFVMTGDGELQEGQNFEALQTAAHQEIANLNVIVDANQVQSDRRVSETIDLGDLVAKMRAFGWYVTRCDGHDQQDLARVFKEFNSVTDRPKIAIADTIKGRGVSFMEHPAALKSGDGFYRWHSGAPSESNFAKAGRELFDRIEAALSDLGLEPIETRNVAPAGAPVPSDDWVGDAYGKTLVDLGRRHEDLVVIDADLALDCRIQEFKETHPERFIENGIAEQDMVSAAGGLALQGYLPVVNSFAAFLAARANEQIYVNACEGTKIIYACHYAGLLPAGPGATHQSLRDISLFAAIPDIEIVAPCNADEARMLTEYCIEGTTASCMLRLLIGRSPGVVALPDDYRVRPGKGVALCEGSDALLFAYGPVMVNQALEAASMLAADGFRLKVINMPWLNVVDGDWLSDVVAPFERLFVVEDHAVAGGLGSHLLGVLSQRRLLHDRDIDIFGVEGFPACGTADEVLAFHELDGATLAKRIMARFRTSATTSRVDTQSFSA